MILEDTLSEAMWKNHLLEDRNLTKPDGRPLYQYRVSGNEYKALQQLLSHFLAKVPLNNIHTRSCIPGLFVLYAAEWWRREFNGSSWSWMPILGVTYSPA